MNGHDALSFLKIHFLYSSDLLEFQLFLLYATAMLKTFCLGEIQILGLAFYVYKIGSSIVDPHKCICTIVKDLSFIYNGKSVPSVYTICLVYAINLSALNKRSIITAENHVVRNVYKPIKWSVTHIAIVAEVEVTYSFM